MANMTDTLFLRHTYLSLSLLSLSLCLSQVSPTNATKAIFLPRLKLQLFFSFLGKFGQKTPSEYFRTIKYIAAMKPASMAGSKAGRILNTPKLNYNETLLMGLNVSQKNNTPGMDLMQNCDLPPPMKVFTGSDNKTVLSSMNRVYGLISTREEENQSEFDGGHHEKLELLKALRLSQTRAREAENKAEVLARERDCLSDAMFKDAMKLFGHRQLVRLLELQVSRLYYNRAEREKKRRSFDGDHEGDDRGGHDSGVCISWVVALAFCFGIAGVGFALGRSYLF